MARTKKYALNTKTGALHIIGRCRFTNPLPDNVETYFTEDEAISKNKRYMKNCKLCFKNKD